jgi:cytochrome d ubiquinol oxidase subunit I
MTVIFHFWFVTTTVGVMACVLIFELLYAFGKGNTDKYGRLALFFMKIYFFSFAIGVVTGLVMELQFGMNWSAYSSFFGDIIGVPLSIEGITAFFLESTLIGLWRFTWGKIGKRIHVLFGALLEITSLMSVVWIVMINAFMQDPTGYEIVDGQVRLTSLLDLFKNPHYWPEALHVGCAIFILGGMLVCGISAIQIMRKREVELFKKSLQIGLLVFLPIAIIQPLWGDDQVAATIGQNPMKYAAIEANWHDVGSDTTGYGWPVVAVISEENHETYGLEIPNLGPYFGSGKLVGSAKGMEEISQLYHTKYDAQFAEHYAQDGETLDYYPPVTLMFWCMRIMVFTGYFFIIFGTFALFMVFGKKKSIEDHPHMLRAFKVAMFFPYATVIAGWVVAEVGRYPFVVNGLLTQLDAVSPNMTVPKLVTSISAFAVMYIMLGVSMVFLVRKTLETPVPKVDGNDWGPDLDDDSALEPLKFGE